MRTPALALMVPALFLLSCQRSATPVSPAAQEQSAALALAQDPSTGPLFAADLMIDLTTNHAELTPVRQSAAIGDDYSELGLTPAFNKTFGDNFRVIAVRRPAPDTIEVDVQITHPFSPANRPDLGIFNVKCFVVTDRAPVNLSGVSAAPGVLANADGYSNTWLVTHPGSQPDYTAAPVQPYVILREDPSSAPFNYQSPAGFNVLFPGQTSIDTLALTLSTGNTFQARLYLTADYGQSAVRATRQNPQYDLPKFAGNAAWKVAVTELANDLQAGQPSSTAQYQVDIWDWKHGLGLGSDVASATLQVPGVTSAPVTLSLSGTGSDPTPLTASTLITNGASAGEGDYFGLVTVTDSNQGVGLEENLTTPVSFGSYVTYQVFDVSVEDVAEPPTAAFTRCLGGDLSIGIIETFDASSSVPGTNPIVSYEWDWDYDGSNFTVDATGVIATQSFSAVGTPTVALRVSDGSPAGFDIASSLLAITGPPSWSTTPIRITNDTYWNRWEDQSRTSPVIGIDSTGTAHLIHYRAGSPYSIFHQTLAPCSSDWSAPTEIFTSGGGGVFPVGMAITSDDRLHVSFLASVNNVRYIHNTGGVWSAPVNITSTPGTGGWNYGWIARNYADELGYVAHFQPPQDPAAVNGGGIPAVSGQMYAIRTVGGVWQPQELIGTTSYVTSQSGGGGWSGRILSASLTSTLSNEWITAWDTLKTPHLGGSAVSSACMTKWNRTTGGVWGSESVLTSVPVDSFRIVMATSPNGTIWLTHCDLTNIRLMTYDGTVWTASTTALTGILGSAQPYLAFAPDGQGMLMSGGSNFGTPMTSKIFQQSDSIATIAAMPNTTMVPSATGILQRFPVTVRLADRRWAMVFQSTRFGAFTEGQELEALFWE
ncbi:MAG: hypothetical protein GEEBNDBF_01784 [bacterium]|nr:hypothetical protein [bacterium]